MQCIHGELLWTIRRNKICEPPFRFRWGVISHFFLFLSTNTKKSLREKNLPFSILYGKCVCSFFSSLAPLLHQFYMICCYMICVRFLDLIKMIMVWTRKERARKVSTSHAHTCRRPQNIKTHFSCMGFHSDSIGHWPLCMACTECTLYLYGMDVYISKRLFNI